MPSWDIVERARMVAVFAYQIQADKDNSMLLPKDVRGFLKLTPPTGFPIFI
jgi:hypothetical protein